MRVLITLPDSLSGELGILSRHAQEFDKIHLRKPGWTENQTREYLEDAGELCERLVLCDHFTLGSEFNVGGIHLKESMRDNVHLSSLETVGTRSTSVHRLSSLPEMQDYDYVLFGPVFPSFSKVNYKPGYSREQMSDALQSPRPKTLAIGGIDNQTCETTLQLGFDGYAVLTSFWKPHVEKVS